MGPPRAVFLSVFNRWAAARREALVYRAPVLRSFYTLCSTKYIFVSRLLATCCSAA